MGEDFPRLQIKVEQSFPVRPDYETSLAILQNRPNRNLEGDSAEILQDSVIPDNLHSFGERPDIELSTLIEQRRDIHIISHPVDLSILQQEYSIVCSQPKGIRPFDSDSLDNPVSDVSGFFSAFRQENYAFRSAQSHGSRPRETDAVQGYSRMILP